jgi:hypothetical protein
MLLRALPLASSGVVGSGERDTHLDEHILRDRDAALREHRYARAGCLREAAALKVGQRVLFLERGA